MKKAGRIEEQKEREYIVTLTTRRFFGCSHVENCYAICGTTMKEVKEYAKRNLSGGWEIVSCTAHKVKPGEEVPYLYYR